MNTKVLIILAVCVLLSAASIFWVIRKDGTITERVFWSLFALVPLIGPVCVAAFYSTPNRLPEHLQDKGQLDVLPGHYWEREDTNHFDDD